MSYVRWTVGWLAVGVGAAVAGYVLLMRRYYTDAWEDIW